MTNRDSLETQTLLDGLKRLEALSLADLDDESGAAESGSNRERARFEWAGIDSQFSESVEVPSDRLRESFFSALKEEPAGNAMPDPADPVDAVVAWGVSRVSPWLAAAGVLFGLGLGWLIPGGLGSDVDQTDTDRVVRLEDEVASMGQLLTLSLLDHSSAAERLRGVALSEQALAIHQRPSAEQSSWSQPQRGMTEVFPIAGAPSNGDDEVVSALLSAVMSDDSENVRLAAIDALAGLLGRPSVRSGLAEALPRQRSPMLQVALSDVLSEGLVDEERRAFEELLRQPGLDPDVRARVEAILGGEL